MLTSLWVEYTPLGANRRWGIRSRRSAWSRISAQSAWKDAKVLSNSALSTGLGAVNPSTTRLAHAKYSFFRSKSQSVGGQDRIERRLEILSANLIVCARIEIFGAFST